MKQKIKLILLPLGFLIPIHTALSQNIITSEGLQANQFNEVTTVLIIIGAAILIIGGIIFLFKENKKFNKEKIIEDKDNQNG
ncbi:hypothetical protein KKF61_00840 [Patescibacteria group bacterium]|nr:hypothetical protein [Patescibacteria group bacterium]MBU0964658.1 hypothetical protein [Patescibacteria group bacterium]